jgi:quinol monooxygenase YgiN
MYGTIARLQVKPGELDLLRQMAEQDERQPEGEIGFYVYQMDSDPNEVWLVALFESREAYHANAQSPEQNQQFQQMMQHLVAEPEWHDGEIIVAQ